MSIHAISWVLKHSRSRGSGRLVMIAIADAAHEDGGGAFPSDTSIAESAGVGERTVQRVISEKLVPSGELEVTHRPGTTNLYRLPGVERGGPIHAPTPANMATPTPDDGGDTAASDPGPDGDPGVASSGEGVSPPVAHDPLVTRQGNRQGSTTRAARSNGSQPARTDPVADEVTRSAWERMDRKPLCGFPAVRVRAQEALDAGWSPEVVAEALVRTRAYTRDAIEFQLRGGRTRAGPEGDRRGTALDAFRELDEVEEEVRQRDVRRVEADQQAPRGPLPGLEAGGG